MQRGPILCTCDAALCVTKVSKETVASLVAGFEVGRSCILFVARRRDRSNLKVSFYSIKVLPLLNQSGAGKQAYLRIGIVIEAENFLEGGTRAFFAIA